ncbi:IclR family transcriptional regulator [Neorhizobium sp. NCHU2750]|uniref:IclR family transcriptional regulator n=1 Tax=Neorhizobium sp. NCHU2750 TaxID=1825976 RepID=UPI000E76040C|nr:transcriptional regulator [Neorhizobium sp. NCHU2750]
MKKPSAVTGTQLLDRAIAILNGLGEAGPDGATSVELMETLGLTQPTAHRIISALEREGLVERDRQSRKLRLGMTLFALASAAMDHTGLRSLVRPALVRICAATSDTVFLMARAGFNAICVDRHQGSYLIGSLTKNVGGQIPMGLGSASQAILAFLPGGEIEALIDHNAAELEQYGSWDRGQFLRSLAEIKRQGYALDDGELVAGISAIAMPILSDRRDPIAAIAINLTSARMTPERVPQLVDLLRREILAIEQALGPSGRFMSDLSILE